MWTHILIGFAYFLITAPKEIGCEFSIKLNRKRKKKGAKGQRLYGKIKTLLTTFDTIVFIFFPASFSQATVNTTITNLKRSL